MPTRKRATKRQPYGKGGRVRLLPSGRWQARFVGPDGIERPAPQTFDGKQDAEAWCQRQYQDVEAKRWKAESERPHDRQTFASYARRWLETRELKPRTRQDYQRYLDLDLVPRWGDYGLRRITPELVRDWYASLDPSKPTKRARIYQLFHGIMATAWEDDLITANPCRVRGGGSAKRQRKIVPASPEQFAAIAKAMPDRYRLMVLLAGYCGLRSGELRELRRKDVNLELAQIRVERSVSKVGSEFIVGTPKTEAGIRDAQMPAALVPHVAAHLERFVARDAEALLFPARQGGHMNESSLKKVYFPPRDSVGRSDLRFHDLRHSSAVLAAKQGATLAELMAWLGHASPQAAMIYQHALEDSKVRIAAGLSVLAEETLPEPIPIRKPSRRRAS
jgi:integrase